MKILSFSLAAILFSFKLIKSGKGSSSRACVVKKILHNFSFYTAPELKPNQIFEIILPNLICPFAPCH
jgi:hypothetical protein